MNYEKRILLELINNPSIPYDTLVVELGISRRTVSRVFVSLVEKCFIERIGTNKKDIGRLLNRLFLKIVLSRFLSFISNL